MASLRRAAVLAATACVSADYLTDTWYSGSTCGGSVVGGSVTPVCTLIPGGGASKAVRCGAGGSYTVDTYATPDCTGIVTGSVPVSAPPACTAQLGNSVSHARRCVTGNTITPPLAPTADTATLGVYEGSPDCTAGLQASQVVKVGACLPAFTQVRPGDNQTVGLPIAERINPSCTTGGPMYIEFYSDNACTVRTGPSVVHGWECKGVGPGAGEVGAQYGERLTASLLHYCGAPPGPAPLSWGADLGIALGGFFGVLIVLAALLQLTGCARRLGKGDPGVSSGSNTAALTAAYMSPSKRSAD